MGVSVVFIFALLQIFTLYAGGNSGDPSNITDSSNRHHHHLHPRWVSGRGSAEKEKDGSDNEKEDQSMFYFEHLEYVASKDPPEGAALVSVNKEVYYILIDDNCNDLRVKALKSSETSPDGFRFMVNKDNFEILEWRTKADIVRLSIRCIISCKSHVIVKDKYGISYMAITSLWGSSEVLTLNSDIKGQYFQTENCEEEKKVKPDKIKVIKRVTADNKNCKPVKHVVKFDQGNDKTKSFLKGSTHAFGGAIEASASGTIAGLVQIGGKLTAKYDYTRLKSETTSNLDKALHSASMEIEVPPNHSCTFEIKSKTSTVESKCSGLLTRQYKNDEERTTSLTDIVNKEEVAEILTSVNPCKPLTDRTKCSNA
ncbi:hypothetical protein R3I94_013202 [Phoxinus phoxinus]